MNESQTPIFLARGPYRKRRLRDFAKALPVIGIALLCIPLQWQDGFTNARAVLYIFGVWMSLVVLAAVLSFAVGPEASQTETDPR
jgi:hypothetical protein